MRRLTQSRTIYWGLLVPVLFQLLGNISLKEEPLTAEAELFAIAGCAGENTIKSICSLCGEEAILDLFSSLDGNPRGTGSWTDLDNAGVNLSNPLRVDFTNVPTGTYQFRYSTPAGGSCPADNAILTVRVVGANQIACVDTINVSLESDCTYELFPSHAISGSTVCESQLQFYVFDDETAYLGNQLNANHLGRYLPGILVDPNCPNPICGTIVHVEDKGFPDLSNIEWLPDEIDLLCHDLDYILNEKRSWDDPSYKYFLGGPIVNECSGFRVSVEDHLRFPDCGSYYAQLQRTFVITDEFGNFSDTTLIANFEYPDINDITPLADVIINTCTPEDVEVPKTYPFVINAFGDTVYLTENGCNYSIGFEDRDFTVCNGSKKVERHLKYFDWCTEEVTRIDTLVIKIGDFEAPQIKYNTDKDTLELGTSPFNCTASLSLREEDLERAFKIEIEDCNPTISARGIIESWLPNPGFVDSSFQKGNVIGEGFYLSNIEVGLHRLILTLSDGCKSEANDTIYFRAIDDNPPVMTCIDGLLISMNEGSYARVSYADVNEGSSDNCAIVDYRVRRKVPTQAYEHYDYNMDGKVLGDELDAEGYTRFDDKRTQGLEVEFFCNDLLVPEQDIELWGWDEAGNKSNCWMSVLLEDKIPSACIAPADTIVACYDFALEDYTVFGEAVPALNSCSTIDIEELAPINELNQCGDGMIIRRFRAIKNKGTENERIGPLCAQEITIEAVHDYYVCFPKDVEADCGTDPNIPGPEILGNTCELFAQDIDDVRLSAENDECYKILRTYKLINWCEYTEERNPIIVPRDVDNDNNPGDEDICVIVRPDGRTYYDRDTLETDTIPNAKGYWYNSQSNPAIRSVGYWIYTQHIKVYDTTDPIISYPDTTVYPTLADDCYGEVELPVTIEETCDSYLKVEVLYNENADFVNVRRLDTSEILNQFPVFLLKGRYPVGKHELIFTANDGCGNETEINIPFEVKDDKASAPICKDGIVVEMSYLEDNGSLTPYAQVEPNAFLASPIYDCTGQGPNGLITEYSINRSDASVDQMQKVLSFDCLDINTLVLVQIHAWDETGNNDYCETFVRVQDNDLVCTNRVGADGIISGTITTPEGRSVQNVEVGLSGEEIWMYHTMGDGVFHFEDLPEGKSYTIRPQKNDTPKGGVSTFDLIVVQKHVLGENQIDNPYKLIAADVNNSGGVSTLDMIKLRKMILNIDQSFDQNTSWRFVDASYEFPDPLNPWLEAFPEKVELDNMGELATADFIGIKIGDVNGSVVPNNFDKGTEARSSDVLPIVTTERPLYKGEVYAIPLMVKDVEQIDGMQATISYDAELLQLKDINYNLVAPDQMGLFTESGHLTFSWNRSNFSGQTLSPTLFILYFEAKQNTFLSQVLDINSELTDAEAYNIFGEVLEVQLDLMEAGEEQAEPALYQNAPNPFQTETSFKYYLHEDTEVHFEVVNIQGQRIWQYKAPQSRGNHKIDLNATQFPSKGVYYLRMKAGSHTLTKAFMFQ